MSLFEFTDCRSELFGRIKMIKRLLFAGFSMLMWIPVPSWASDTETMDAIFVPVGTLTLAAPRGMVPRRAPVAFPHSIHFGDTCNTCHHTWDGKSPVSNCTASGCHDRTAPVKEAKSDIEPIRFFKEAYHQNCLGCHRRLLQKRQGLVTSGAVMTQPLPKTGPTGCVQCHPRN